MWRPPRIVSRLPFGSRVLAEIRTLCPERDHQRIIQLSLGHDFAWDTTRALELALLRTFGVPSIARLLDATGQFYEGRAQKRYDDTSLLLATLFEEGYETGAGARALARINALHARYEIPNEDYLYVLSTFVLEPLRWVDRFGWRQTIEVERDALYAFWRAVGGRMGITDIPPTLEAMDAWNRETEAARFACTPATRRLGRTGVGLVTGWWPRWLSTPVEHVLLALIDEPLRTALDLPAAPQGVPALVTRVLRARARTLALLPRRREAPRITDRRWPTYPTGYDVDRLGPTGT